MQVYINTVSLLADRLRSQFSNQSWQQANNDLNRWKDARNKHEVENYYDQFIFGICYAKNLYKSRVHCFYELLKDIQRIDGITNIFQNSSEITSFGCGPGPEIAAYICFIRNILYCRNTVLNFTAVDQLGYWQSFIDEISQLDYNVSIEFKNEKLNYDYVRKMTNSHVCIMSYPHAVKFDNIWHELKSKFLLIIVIDQAKYSLLNKVRLNGYKTGEFECLGNKTYFYYFAEENFYSSYYEDESDDYDTEYCERGIHEISDFYEDCFEIVEKLLDCGHVININCYQFNEPVNCTEIVDEYCDRNVHKKSVKCGTRFVCTEMVNISLICGHKETVKCCSTSYPPCNNKVQYSLKCGHVVDISCSINESIKKYGKHESIESHRCQKLIENKLKCGHDIQIRCYEKNDSNKCSKIITEICEKGLHQISYKCGVRPFCSQLISTLLNCGHSIETECGDKSTKICNKTFSYKLTCGHFTKITCKINEAIKNCAYHDYLNNFKCSELVPSKLKCGHYKEINCYQRENPGTCSKRIRKMCSRNIHEEIMECRLNFVCKKPFKLQLNCGHFTEIECNQSDSIKNSIECKMKINKFCNREIHKHFVSCNEKVVCTENCSKTLSCGHSVSVDCDEFDQEKREYCQKEIMKTCQNKLHANKIKCGDKSVCLIPIKLKLFCGDETEFVCNEIDYENRYQIKCKEIKPCSHECFIKCICKIFKFLPNGSKNEENQVSSCGHKYDKFCDEICGKQLICGHFCDRICQDCLNGRLHNYCRKSCDNIMKCGHKCKSYCHKGSCWECVENCLLIKFQNFSIFNRNILNNVKKQWIDLNGLLSHKAPIEIQSYMNDLVNIMDDKSYSQFWLKHYKFTVKFFIKIINFYNLILNWEFSIDVSDYVDYLKECTIFILKWLNPNLRNLTCSINNDLMWEFKRLKDIFLLLTFCTGASNSKKTDDLIEYKKILENLINIKYNSEQKQNVIDKINFIYGKIQTNITDS